VSRTISPRDAVTEIFRLSNTEENDAALRALLERVDPPLPWMKPAAERTNEESLQHQLVFETPIWEDRKRFAAALVSRWVRGGRKKTTRKPKRKHFRKRTSRRT
jgi:hypothetical protein